MALFWSAVLFLLYTSRAFSTHTAFEELQDFGVVCEALDTCKVPRTSDSLDKYTCQCGPDCHKYGTCCRDAPAKNKRRSLIKASCISPGGSDAYFMVDSCPPSDSGYTILCSRDTSDLVGQPEDNIFSLAPVTSLASKLTYKNYYCFKCNERTDEYVFWSFRRSDDINYRTSLRNLLLIRGGGAWRSTFRSLTSPVTLIFEVPVGIESALKVCVPGVISSCSPEFQGKDINEKCQAYTSYVTFGKRAVYKNPHCALCHFEDLDDMECGAKLGTRVEMKRKDNRLTFAHLLDTGWKHGNSVGYVDVSVESDVKVESGESDECKGDNKVWDGLAKKCRDIVCAVPGLKLENGKCAPP